MELTRQEAIKKHRELWHEITRRTLEEKRKVLLKDIRLDDTPNRLWLCEYNIKGFKKDYEEQKADVCDCGRCY